MSADLDLVKRAIVFGGAVVLALRNGAFNALVRIGGAGRGRRGARRIFHKDILSLLSFCGVLPFVMANLVFSFFRNLYFLKIPCDNCQNRY